MAQSMQRLSSGFRINRALDGAPGLAISSKMTSQVRGLNQAVRNANDAISMIQVAEGATQAVTDMLQRMRELAVQAVSDSNTDSDRTALRAEVTQLVADIGRISDNTQWNGTQLLDGSTYATPAHFQIGSNANQTIAVEMADLSHSSAASVFGTDLSSIASDIGVKTNVVGNVVKHGTEDVQIDRNVWTTIGSGIDFSTDAANSYDFQSASFSPHGHQTQYHQRTLTNTLGAAGGIFELDSTVATGTIKAAYVVYLENEHYNKSLQVEFRLNDGNLELRTTNQRYSPRTAVDYSVPGQDPVATYNGLNFAVGSYALDLITINDSKSSITRIDQAIGNLNNYRSTLGASQNRLEYAADNLTNIAQNTQAARSRILDTDYASESTELARTQILQQAGTAMLAQANTQAQIVTSLLP